MIPLSAIVAMFSVVAFVMTEAMWTLAIGQIVVVLGLIIKSVVDQLNRVQDRHDKELVAKLALEARTKIIDTVQETKEVSVEAFRVANGHNTKIIELRQDVKDAVAKIADTPIKAEVVNTVHAVIDDQIHS